MGAPTPRFCTWRIRVTWAAIAKAAAVAALSPIVILKQILSGNAGSTTGAPSEVADSTSMTGFRSWNEDNDFFRGVERLITRLRNHHGKNLADIFRFTTGIAGCGRAIDGSPCSTGSPHRISRRPV